ncbi:MAG TPA: hypothetical protein VG265_16610 [Gaiellaceae bacterium]|jgi:hypothetical protein|nr:hypothetical protein [Gaiellaceae bacterium]
MSVVEEDETGVLPESVRVTNWRMKTLLDAGYAYEEADVLARDHTVDLHRAVELADRGCPPAVAVAILA